MLFNVRKKEEENNKQVDACNDDAGSLLQLDATLIVGNN
jgi:hypothetical protein